MIRYNMMTFPPHPPYCVTSRSLHIGPKIWSSICSAPAHSPASRTMGLRCNSNWVNMGLDDFSWFAVQAPRCAAFSRTAKPCQNPGCAICMATSRQHARRTRTGGRGITRRRRRGEAHGWHQQEGQLKQGLTTISGTAWAPSIRDLCHRSEYLSNHASSIAPSISKLALT